MLNARASAGAGNALVNESLVEISYEGENGILTWNRSVVGEVKQDEMIEEEVIDILYLCPFPFLSRAHVRGPGTRASQIEVENALGLFRAPVRVRGLAGEAGEAYHVDGGSCFVSRGVLGWGPVCLRSGLHPFVLL